MIGFRFSERHRIKPMREKRNGDQRRQHHRHDYRDFTPRRAAEASHRPERQIAKLAIVADVGEQTRAGSSQRGKCNAGEKHDCHRCPPAAARNHVEQERRHQRADERCDRKDLERKLIDGLRQQCSAEHDRERRGEPRAGRDADQPGIGERIAKQTLHHRAGSRERSADGCPEQQARQSDLGDHQRVAREIRLLARIKPQQNLEHASRRDGN